MDNTLLITRNDLQSYVKMVFGTGFTVSNVSQIANAEVQDRFTLYQ